MSSSNQPGVGKSRRRGWLDRLPRSHPRQRDQAERYAALWSLPTLLMVELDGDGYIAATNTAWCHTLGADAAAWCGQRFSDLVHRAPEHAPAPTPSASALTCGAPPTVLPMQHRDGHAVWVEWCGVTRHRHWATARQLYVGRDVSERRRAEAAGRVANETEMQAAQESARQVEARERASQHLELLGRLAGGVAHDFNNRLTVILGNANLMRFGLRSGADLTRHIDVIENAALRAAQLTQKLLGFARKGKLQNIPVDLHRTIGQVMGLLSRTVDKRIVLRQELAAPAAWVQGDPGQLQQVLLNLATNAAEAMPEGGELRLQTRAEQMDAETRHMHGDLPAGPYLVIGITDTGDGIPADVLPRIFEPCFTTKSSGGNVGMGLPMVDGIVRNHGGFITVASVAHQGTTFDVYLPTCAPARASAVMAGPATSDWRGQGRILVVEDEFAVREVVVGMLQHLGYETVATANGREAIDYLRDHPGSMDAALIDLVMPVMSGKDCCRELGQLDPQVKLVVASGQAIEKSPHDFERLGAHGFLQKPFAAAALGEELQRVLAG